MNNDMFFISEIEDAIESENPYSALEFKISEIISTGQRPGYTNGLYQFDAFLNKIREIIEYQLLDEQYVKLIEGLWNLYCDGMEKRGYLDLLISRDSEPIATIPVKPTKVAYEINNVSPAFYSFELSSGRLLWEGLVYKTDLLWKFANPGKDFRLAADTDGAPPKPTREMTLLDGEVIIRIFPGLEVGSIQIDLVI
jgi:hypothetical protein